MAFRCAFFVLVSASFTAAGCSASGGGSKVGDDGDNGVTGGATGSGGTTNIPGTGGTGAIVDPGMPPDAGADCDSVLEVTYRDLRAHPDFEMRFTGDVVRRGLVAHARNESEADVSEQHRLPGGHDDAARLRQLDRPSLTNRQRRSFAEWYSTSAMNQEIPGTIELMETPPGSGEYVYESDAFFPLGPADGFGVTPAGHYLGKNFLFTTEIHLKFELPRGTEVHVPRRRRPLDFVNGKLAMDLGSMHGPEQGTIDFDAQAAELDITAGQSYPMDIFHAERHTDGSNFRVTTNIACFTDVVVR